MTYSNWIRKAFCFGPILVILGGCANEKAHENFKVILDDFVGRDISAARNFFRIDKTEIKKLANGNVEYRLTGQETSNYGLCIKAFEVEPVSQKVLRATFVGTKRDCIVPL